ncbi:hypothetical protein NGA76_10140 [Lactococcus formosensis]|uniref:hypothetical protein n=1 Tax=Lactococcus formosensis TaxID=1281486 RepID=UPI002434C1E1|nr:hypothetical protein [Lactococcus formosensis]MDG6171509.1 hypothetical protein [Lactococcus formosensis]
MPLYLCNKHADNHGLHEVHTSDCHHLPLPDNRIEVGYFSTCREAIEALENANRGKGFTFDGCYYCSPACHKG